ncbi:OLC1v1002620C2 [Oldenlandia corymbosa var. corymbosa]|uniref:OLC1v1002620C2 n=1 Tax=Oldenlandia corymbosa var. corymbosa TaxID=529605 RepID=A0AAV1D894_OLDCO|nr:OLC1v1002620C2 [Oldenlandia corymbosa var. corymbosa]
MMYTRETNPDVPSSACIKPCEFCFMIKEEVDLTEIYFLLQLLEQRVETLERELDAAISAAARARNEKRQAEAAQKAAELRSLEVTKELENTTKVFELHMEELRAKQEEISKRDHDIKLLEAIIQTLGGRESSS